MSLKHLCLIAAAASFALAACASPPNGDVVMTAERAASVARGSHYLACSGVEQAHASELLVGKPFNDAKAACVQADGLLDAADLLLSTGQTALAGAKVSDAMVLIYAAHDAIPAGR